MGKKLKKNEVSVDVINLGAEINIPFLEKFIESVNKDDTSHFINIKEGSGSIGD